MKGKKDKVFCSLLLSVAMFFSVFQVTVSADDQLEEIHCNCMEACVSQEVADVNCQVCSTDFELCAVDVVSDAKNNDYKEVKSDAPQPLPSNTEDGITPDNPMAVPVEGMVISGGTFYGISKKWFEENNPDKTTLYFSIQIPETVVTIASDGFRDSYSSEKEKYNAVTYNDNLGRYNVVSIDFSKATALTTIKSQAAMGCAISGVLDLSRTKIKTIEKSGFSGCSGLTGVILPSSLEILGSSDGSSGSVFNGCSSLQFVRAEGGDPAANFELPSGLKVIGKQTFKNTFPKGADLKIKVPASVEIIGSEAFYSNSCFSQIYIERTADYERYDSGAFKAASTTDCLLILPNYTAYKSTGAFTRITKTYPVILEFMNGEGTVTRQEKLFGQSIRYARDQEGIWYMDENYVLPETGDVSTKPGYDAGWRVSGDTKILTSSSRVSGWEDEVLVVEIVNDAIVSKPDVDFVVNGNAVQDLGTGVAKLMVEISDSEEATAGVKVTHPLASEEAKESGTYVYFKYCWWDEVDDSVNGPRSKEQPELFSSAENSSKLNRIYTDQSSIVIRSNADARTEGDCYLVEIYGYYVENNGTPKQFYKSNHNFIGSAQDGTHGEGFVMEVDVTDSGVIPQPEYNLTVENGTGDGVYTAGTPVTITADTAPAGKVFDRWVTSAGGSFADAESAQTVFTMPAGDVTVTAVYKDVGGGVIPQQKYNLTVENGTGDGVYTAGTPVTITADTASAGKVFDRWVTSAGGSFADAESAQTVFTMPAGDVTVTAVYKDVGGGVIPQQKYNLTVENGTGDGVYTDGTPVTITADAAPAGKVFDRWVTSAGGSFADAESAQTVFTMPAGDVTVTAVYKNIEVETSEPDNPDGEDKTDSPDRTADNVPQTGDRSQVFTWMLALTVSVVCLITVLTIERKKNCNR